MAAQKLHQFFEACIRKRVPPEKFHTLFQTFIFKHDSLPGRILVDVLLDEGRKASKSRPDPRIPLYIREVLQMQVASTSDVLAAILPLPVVKDSTVDDDQSVPTVIDAPEYQNPRTETLILQMMSIEISNGFVNSKEELQDVLRTMVKTKHNVANSEALGYLISAILNTTLTHDILSHSSSKSVQIASHCHHLGIAC